MEVFDRYWNKIYFYVKNYIHIRYYSKLKTKSKQNES